MRDAFSQIKYYVSFAETCLKRANKQWAYYKNGTPFQVKLNLIFLNPKNLTKMQRNLQQKL